MSSVEATPAAFDILRFLRNGTLNKKAHSVPAVLTVLHSIVLHLWLEDVFHPHMSCSYGICFAVG